MNVAAAGETPAETPDIAGLSVRRFMGPQDYPAMSASIHATNTADGVEEVEGEMVMRKPLSPVV